MHKSIGNVYLLSDLEKWGSDALAFRMLVLNNSYRKGLDFTRDGLQSAQNRLDSWRGIIADAWQATGGAADAPSGDDPIRMEFVAAMTDDFNTPRALAQAEKALGQASTGDVAAKRRALGLLFDMDRILGLSLRDRAARTTELPPEARALIDEREAARGRKDWKRSDELRDELLSRFGIRIKDTKDGPRWEREDKGA
jgi:cysteinyl-tRNA synthetase